MPIVGLEEDLQVIAEQLVADAAESMMDDLKAACPVATGELLESGHIEVEGLTINVAFDAPQADWTDQGVEPHGIDGNPLMTFYWENGWRGPGVYSFTHVDHPGQAATHWFSDITDEWDTYITAAAAA